MRVGGSLRVALALALVTPVLAGCATDDDLDEEDEDVLRRWRADQVPRQARGLSGDLQIEGQVVALTGNLTGTQIETPFQLAPGPVFPDDEPFVFFGNATLGAGGQGLLVLDGDHLEASSGTMSQLPVEQVQANDTVRMTPIADGEPVPEDRWTFPSNWSQADEALFFAQTTAVDVNEVTLSGFDRGLFLTTNASQTVESPVTVSADRIAWNPNGSVVVDEAELDVTEVGISGNATQGVVDPENSDPVQDPDAVFGHDGRLVIAPGTVETTDEIQVTQILKNGTAHLAANVQIHPTRTTVNVAPNETEWVRVLYRERSNLGDGLLENATVTGPGSAMVEVPVERAPLLVEELWGIVGEAGPAGLVFGIPLAPASPFLLLAEGLDCLAFGCPDQHPYPAWIEAGEVGSFYVKVEGSGTPGPHETNVTIDGRNYEPVHFPLRVNVTAPQEGERPS